MSDKEFVEKVREHNDLVEVASQYVSLRRHGNNLLGLCPFHEERTPSFSISSEKQLYYCFGCQAGGDVFNFVMGIEGYSFPEAVTYLAERVGLEPPQSKSPQDQEVESRQTRMKRYLYGLAEHVTRLYERVLESPDGAKARQYLAERGVSTEVQQRFRLGYAPDGWQFLCDHLQKQSVSMKAAHLLGLVKDGKSGDRYYDAFRDRLVFPITDLSGRPVAMGGRVLGVGEPKYLNSSENPIFSKGEIWYGLSLAREHIRRRDRVILVEGYMDVLSCVSYGWPETVASMGTALTQDHARLIARYTRNVYLAYDGDAAGVEAILRGMRSFHGTGVHLKVLAFPENKDPDDVLRSEHGREAFESILQQAQSLFDFLWDRARRQHDLSKAEGKAYAVAAMTGVIVGEDDPVVRADRVRFLAQSLRIPEEAVRSQIQKNARLLNRSAETSPAGEANAPVKVSVATPNRAYQKAERLILSLMVKEPAFGERARGELEEGHFQEGVHPQIARVLLRSPAMDPRELQNSLLHSCESEEEKREIARIFIEELPAGEEEKVFSDCIRLLRRREIEERLEILNAQMAEMERDGEAVSVDLLHEQMHLSRELKGRMGRHDGSAHRE